MKQHIRYIFSVTLVLFLGGTLSSVQGAADKLRLIWRDNPATSMVVAWNQVSGHAPRLSFGPEDHGNTVTAYPEYREPDVTRRYRGMNNHFVRLTGLKPDTAYYAVLSDSEGAGERFWFQTAPDRRQPFTFVAGGDTRTNAEPRRDGNRMIARLRPLFVVHGGDYMGKGSPEEWQEWLDDWQLTRSTDGRMTPLVPAHGNHENNDLAMIYKLFDTPRPEMFYTLGVADGLMRLYILNTELERVPSLWDAQAAWLRRELPRHADDRWSAAVYHRPMRPHTAAKSEGNLQREAWAYLFYDHGVDLAVESDTHMVKRTYPVRPDDGPDSHEGFIRDDAKGTVYIGEGSWGAPKRPTNDDKPWTLASDSFWQFKWIRVSPETMDIRCVNLETSTGTEALSGEANWEIPDGVDLWDPPTGALLRLPFGQDGAPAPVSTPLVSFGATWGYHDGPAVPGTGWEQFDYDHSGWPTGRAPLGYGDEGQATEISFGGKEKQKHMTAYFRHRFEVAPEAAGAAARLRWRRDDGLVIYLNGKEVARDNLPSGSLSADTPAKSGTNASQETAVHTLKLPAGLLREGTNVLAVEVHQVKATSSDLTFDLELTCSNPK